MPLYDPQPDPGREASLGSVRVLHILGSSKYGGVTNVVFRLIEHVQQRGWHAAILTGDAVTAEVCQNRGVEAVVFQGINRPIRPWTDLRDLRRLEALLRTRGDTIVHTHTLKGGVLGRWAAYRAGVPVIVHHSHGMSFQDCSPRMRKAIIAQVERFAARRCDHIVSANEADIDWAVAARVAPRSHFTYVPNGLSAPAIDAAMPLERTQLTAPLGIPADAYVLALVARLVAEKGHPWLFQAMAEVQAVAGRSVHLLLLGDGADDAAYREQVQRLGIADRVHFLGFRTDPLPLVGACDAFVLPSLREGHSLTVLEAMALGRPIIATDIRGIRDSARHEQEALLVPPRDSAALAEALRRLAGGPALARRLGEQARRRFLDEFTDDRMCDRVWQVYQNVLAAKGSRDSRASGAS